MHKSKGISPLVASVLLLAVTLSAASIFSGWGPNLVRLVTDETDKQTNTTIDCSQAGVEIISAKYFSSDSETSIVLSNTGRSDLDELRAAAWQNNLPMNETTTSLVQGNQTVVNITTTSKPDKVETWSKECSSATDDHEEING